MGGGVAQNSFTTQATKFFLVGLFGYAVDTVTFNLFLFIFAPEEWALGPLVSKALATVVAVLFTYVANTRWTFIGRAAAVHDTRQFIRFVLVNSAGLAIMLLCLAISHYVLGYDNIFADNVSANIFGAGLAMVFRFLASRYWVYKAITPEIFQISTPKELPRS